MKRTTDDGIYSGTSCDKCGGPTYRMPSGSIWCSAEDPHAGGHFVVRVAFAGQGCHQTTCHQVTNPCTRAEPQQDPFPLRKRRIRRLRERKRVMNEKEGLRAQSRGVQRHHDDWVRRGRPTSSANPFAGYGWVIPVVILVGVILAIVAQAPR